MSVDRTAIAREVIKAWRSHLDTGASVGPDDARKPVDAWSEALDENERLERIAKAAAAFVDEQGKRTRDDGTLAEPQDFAAGCWRDLVAAVTEAGR